MRLTLARYLALGLEFQLGADILSAAIAPTGDQIGKLGAIAVIRTALNFLLGREIREETARGGDPQRRRRTQPQNGGTTLATRGEPLPVEQPGAAMEPRQFTQVEEGARVDRWVPSTCGICSLGCGLEVAAADGRIVGVRGRADHPVGLGRLGPRG